MTNAPIHEVLLDVVALIDFSDENNWEPSKLLEMAAGYMERLSPDDQAQLVACAKRRAATTTDPTEREFFAEFGYAFSLLAED